MPNSYSHLKQGANCPLRLLSFALLILNIVCFSHTLSAQESQADTSLYYSSQDQKILIERVQEELRIQFRETTSISNAMEIVSRSLIGATFTIDSSQFNSNSVLRVKLHSRLTTMVAQSVLKQLNNYDAVKHVYSLRDKVHLNINEYSSEFYGGKNLKFSIDTNHIYASFISPVDFDRFETKRVNGIDYSKDWVSLNSSKARQIPLLNEEKYNSTVAGLEGMDEVSYVAPVLVGIDKDTLWLYEDFFVDLKNQGDTDTLFHYAQILGFNVSHWRNEVYRCSVNKFSLGNSFEIARFLNTLNVFKFAEPDFIFRIYPSNEHYGLQWGLNNTGSNYPGSPVQGGDPNASIHAEEAWDIIGGGSQDILVAVIDLFSSELEHPDNPIDYAHDATGNDFSMSDNSIDVLAHGIACAGIIAADDNGIGVKGVAYNVKTIAINIYDNPYGQPSSASGSIVSGAIIWAINSGSDVISNSNTFSWEHSSLINPAIVEAVTLGRGGKGIPFLSSSGNDNYFSVNYPAYLTNTVAVGASTMCDERKRSSNNIDEVDDGVFTDLFGVSCDGNPTWGSNYGAQLDVMAPGVRIYTTDIVGAGGFNSGSIFGSDGNYYNDFQGTSAACPMAAGTMALILSANPNLTGVQAREILESTCDKVGGYNYANNPNQTNGTWHEQMGHGRINAGNAVHKAKETRFCPDFNAPIVPTANWQTDTSSIAEGHWKLYQVGDIVAGETYTFKTCCGDGGSSDFPATLELSNASCDVISSGSSQLTWTANYSGLVYLKVQPISGDGQYTMAYRRVVEPPEPCNVSVSPSSASATGGYNAGTNTFTVNATGYWTIDDNNCDWIVGMGPLAGSGTENVTVAYSGNPELSSRQCNFSVTCENSIDNYTLTQPGPQLTLNSPSNGADNVSCSSGVNFSWSSNVSPVEYRIQISTVNNWNPVTGFSNPVASVNTGSNTFFNWPEAESGTTYYWAVRVYDSETELPSEFTQPRVFNTGNCTNATCSGTPTVEWQSPQPSDQSLQGMVCGCAGNQIDLLWSGNSNCTISQYQVELSAPGVPNDYEYTTSNSEYVPFPQDFMSSTTITFRVRGQNADGWGAWSEEVTVYVFACSHAFCNGTSCSDPYEPNNSTQNATDVVPAFSNNEFSYKTIGSCTDEGESNSQDYYKVELPPGYNYTITSRLQDSWSSNDGNQYTGDMQYSSWNSQTGQWSVWEDTQLANFNLNSGGSIYFVVDNYNFNSSSAGSYAFEFDITRTPALPNLRPHQMSGWSAPLVVTDDGGYTSSSTYLSIDNLYYHLAYENNGNAVAGSFITRVYLNNSLIQTFNSCSFDSPDDCGGQSGAAPGGWEYFENYNIGTLSPGNYELRMEIDANNSVGESNEYDNEQVVNFTVNAALPDLLPHTPSGWPAPLVASTTTGTNSDASTIYNTQNVYVDMRVINQGIANASTFNCKLYLDETLIDTHPVSGGFGVGSTTGYTDLNIGQLTTGTHELKIVMDADGQVAESNEFNNTYIKTINVLCNLPSEPSTINGNSETCPYATNTYTVTSVSGITYSWSVNGGYIVSGQGTNQIQVNFTSPGNNSVSVTPLNSCGQGDASTLPVQVTTTCPEPFITTWQTDNPGTSANNQITIPTTGGGYNYNIYWEEVGNATNNGTLTGQTGSTTITFSSTGEYRVEISGDFPRIYFNNDGDKEKLLTIEQWGSIEWSSMARAFWDCSNLTSSATDAPDLTGVTSLHSMFRSADSFNSDIGLWNVSNVTIMESMFSYAISFNQDVGNWDVSNVTNMRTMFLQAFSFNQDLGSWNVSNVSNMYAMFNQAFTFNQNIGPWTLNPDVNLVGMLNASGLDCENYSATLIGWDNNNPTVSNRSLNASGRQYGTNAVAARNNLLERGWSISEDSAAGIACPCESTFSTINPSECNSYTAPDGQVYTASGEYTAVIPNVNGCDSTITINLTINEPPSEIDSISGNSTLCVGSNGAYSILPVIGAASYTWSFSGDGTPSGSGTTVLLSPTSGGTLTVTATNSCGSTSNSVEIEVSGNPETPAISGPTEICSETETSYSVEPVGAANSYTWSYTGEGILTDNGTSITLHAETGGVLSVIAIGECGSAETSLSIEVGDFLNTELVPSLVDGGHNISCNGASSGSITIEGLSGNDTYSFSWSGPAGYTSDQQNISELEPGNYCVEVTSSSGCSSFNCVVLTEPEPITGTLSSPEFDGGWNIDCHGAATGSISSSISGGTPPYSYSWDGPGIITSENASIEEIVAGTYCMAVFDANNCYFTTCITLTEPDAPTISCPENITVDADPELCGQQVSYDFPEVINECDNISSYQFLITEAHVVSVNDNWCGDVEEPTCDGIFGILPDIYVQIRDANSNLIYQSPHTNNTLTGSWIGVTVGADNGPYTVQVWDEDENSSNDVLGSFSFEINAAGIINFGEPESTSGYLVVEVNGTSLSMIEGLPSGSLFPVGTTNQVFELSDGFGNSSICSFEIIVNPVSEDAGSDNTLSVCENDGEINLFDQLLGSPSAGGEWTNPDDDVVSGTFNPDFDLPGVYTYTIGSGNCENSATVTVVVNENAQVEVAAEICSGQDYTLPNGTTVIESGEYPVTLTAQSGCDSVVTTNLEVLDALETTVETVICDGENYELPDGSLVSETGDYPVVLESTSGCDSIVTTQLFVNPTLEIIEDVVICQGESYTLPDGTTTSEEGQYTTITQDEDTGCDITTITAIEVLPNYETIVEAIICEGENYELSDGTLVYEAGNYPVIMESTSGCDSIVTTQVFVNPTVEIAEDVMICQGDSYTLPDGTMISEEGVFTTTTLDENTGCEIATITTVEVEFITLTSLEVSICSGESYQMPDGIVVNESGEYTVMLSSLNGCDSLVVTNLTIADTIFNFQQVDLCPEETTVLPDGSETAEAGEYLSYFTAASGCDSVVVTEVGTHLNETGYLEAAICEGEVYVLPDEIEVFETGVYESTISSVYGCDSTITTVLKVGEHTDTTLTVSACGSYLAPDEVVYDESGIYTAVIPNMAGCDSTITIELSIEENVEVTENITACDSYILNGATYTNTGSYTQIITTPEGCVETTTLNLEVLQSTESSQSMFACDSLVFNGQTHYESGVYEHLFTNQVGCDSVVSLNLFIPVIDTSLTEGTDGLLANAENVSYQWMHCDSNMVVVEGATDQVFIPTSSGYYSVQLSVTDPDNPEEECTFVSECHWFDVIITGNEDIVEHSMVVIFPNPNDGSGVQAMLSGQAFNDAQAIEFHLYDAIGNLIQTNHFVHFGGRFEQEIRFNQPLESGTYVFKVLANEQHLRNIRVTVIN